MLNFKKYKVINFQSDDWGWCGLSRDYVSSEKLYNLLNNEKISEWQKGFFKSTLESAEDLDRLFSILLKYKGIDGRYPIFQAGYIIVNPDYEKIESSGFKQYYEIPFPNFPDSWQRPDLINKVKEGMQLGIWHPIYHGKSHFNIKRWMKLLRGGDSLTRELFKLRTFNLFNPQLNLEYSPDFCNCQEKDISAGLAIFKDMFGYAPKTVIAPTYVWQAKTERLFAKYGIKVIEGKNLQIYKRSFLEKVKGKALNLFGLKSYDKPWQIEMGDYYPGLDLVYLVRNVEFEPRGNSDPNNPLGVEGAYQKILAAWSKNEPAVISTHRINYAYLDETWIKENLRQLDELLAKLHKNHPEIAYLSDWELAQLYKDGFSQ